MSHGRDGSGVPVGFRRIRGHQEVALVLANSKKAAARLERLQRRRTSLTELRWRRDFSERFRRLGFRSRALAARYGMRRMRALGPLLKARPEESGAATRGTRRCGEAASARTQESGLKTKTTWRAGPTSQRDGLGCGCVRRDAVVAGKRGQPHARTGGRRKRAARELGRKRSGLGRIGAGRAGIGEGFSPRSILRFLIVFLF